MVLWLLIAAQIGLCVGFAALPTTRRPHRTNLVTLSLEEDDLSLLARRIGELKSVHRVRGVVLPEVLLPGQRMRLSMMPPALAEEIRSNETICTLGARLGEGDSPSLFMSCGVEAHVTELKQEFSDSGYGDATRWSATIVGGRIFERLEQSAPVLSADANLMTFEEDVRWLDLGLSDALSAARSPSRGVVLAARELGPLVQQWIELASGGGETLWGRKRDDSSPSSGGVDPAEQDKLEAVVQRMLDNLGEMPGVERPSERALWVAALINPCGADKSLWPTIDVRPGVLTATTPLERLSVAKTGLIDSLYKLKGGNWPRNSYYW